MRRYFDQTITINFYPIEAERCDVLLLDDANVDIYLFDEFPSLEEAANNVGDTALQTVLAWSLTRDSFGRTWDFAPIPDPEPTTDNREIEQKYYYSVNASKDGIKLPPLVRELCLGRLRAQESYLTCEIMDIVTCDPNITEFCRCIGDIELYIQCAIDDIKSKLNGCCTKWQDILNPAELKRAVMYRALSRFYFAQSRNVSDIYYAHGLRYESEAKSELKRSLLKIDKNQDGKPEGVRGGGGSRFVRIIR